MAKKIAKTTPAVTTTVKVNDKVAKAIEVIKAHHPHVKVAYFNAEGEFHFHKRPGFKAVALVEDEEEIDLGTETPDIDETDPPTPPGGNIEF